MNNRTTLLLCALSLFLLGTVIGIGLAGRHGLWADELFSIAVATGHSLEHPAELANPALGDFMEGPDPLPPSVFKKQLVHETPPAGLDRVNRAVFLSGTNPPLYYLMLYYWMGWFGTGDAALRLLSVIWAMACFPFIWSLARRLGGRPALVPTAVLFTFSPLCLCYATEGRMYSLLWFFAVFTVWLTQRLDRKGVRLLWAALWILAAFCGFMTHYYYAFIWLACLLWLFFRRKRLKGTTLAVMVLAVLVLVLPWYRLIPQTMENWRVTHDWLHGYPPLKTALLAPLKLGWSFVSNRGWWGGSFAADLVLLAVVILLAALLVRRCSGRLVSGQRGLVILWGLGACLGPALFDLIRQTSASLIPRYAIGGLPAGLLLLGLGLGRLRPTPRMVVLLAILAAWFPGNRSLYLGVSRCYEPYREVGAELSAWAEPSDLVLVHSIPSGVLGIARYLDADTAMASWVEQLGRRRIPEDLERLTAGRRRVVLVEIHAVGAPLPEEEWLRENARLDRETGNQAARLLYFSLQ